MDTSIAVVDDDERILTSLGALLTSEGYGVRLFASGTEFAASGCVAKIDCLICDIAMPGMDGLEVMRMAHESRPALPVILVTGCCDVHRGLPAAADGQCSLFRKPFDSHELLTAVARAVVARASRGSHLR